MPGKGFGMDDPELRAAFEDTPEEEQEVTEVSESSASEGQGETPETPETVAPEPPKQESEEPGTVTESEESDTQAEATEEAEKPKDRLYAGKYQTEEQLEEGYNQLRNRQRQQAEEWRQEQVRFQQEIQQRDAAIARVVPVLQRLQAEGVLTDEATQESPQQMEQRLRAEMQQQTQAQQQQYQQQQWAGEIQAFRAAHPDLPPGSDTDFEIMDIFKEFQTDTDNNGRPTQPDPSLFPVTRDNLEVALELARDPRLRTVYTEFDLEPDVSNNPGAKKNLDTAREIVDNPALASVLRIHPHLTDSDAGMEWARAQAGSQPGPPSTQNGRSKQQVQAERQAAYVEKGGTGAPVQTAPGDEDPFDEVLKYAQDKRSNYFGRVDR